jgi:hypothetical protein
MSRSFRRASDRWCALDARQAERLEESLYSRAKKKGVVKCGELLPTSRGWRVVLDDQEIGTLGSGTHKRVREAWAAGFPLTCRVWLLREPEQPLRVMADLPSDSRRAVLRRSGKHGRKVAFVPDDD